MNALLAALVPGMFALAAGESPRSSASIPDETGLPGVFETHSSRPMASGTVVLGAFNRLQSGKSLVEGGKVTGSAGDSAIGETSIASFRGFLAAGMGLGVDAALYLPLYYENIPGAGTTAPGAKAAPETWTLGDLSGIVKARLPFDIPFLSLSLFATGSAPTSSGNGPILPKQPIYHPSDDHYPNPVAHAAGLSKPRAGAGVGATLDLSEEEDGPQVILHANLSGERTLSVAASEAAGSLSASLAAEASLSRSIRLEAEMRHQRLPSGWNPLDSLRGQWTTMGLGLGWKAPVGFSIRVGGMVAPTAWNPYRTLNYLDDAGQERSLRYRTQSTLSGFLQIAWQGFPLGRDRDHDGVPDGRDRCPGVREDKDGFQDEDGCPEPDNDGDAIPDALDGCPYAPEDHDRFDDGDGCPETDNDHDGFLDSLDHCPYDPEDRDGVQDEDGCPDPDDDKDGIPDAVDKCPRQAEKPNGVEDEDGCPELDTDGDRIPDSRDKCPTEDEIINFYQDEDGCPDEKPEPIRDDVLKGVDFETGGSGLLPASFPILDALAMRLMAYPGTEIEVQGHMDDRAGKDAQEVSQSRAEAVAEYLGGRGVEARRMKPVGYGSSKPLSPNRSAQGRAENRRIQIRRLN